MTPVEQHQREIEKNLRVWRSKPLLQAIYAEFYREMLAQIDSSLCGKVVELGSGIGHLKSYFPEAICTDIFSNPWIDCACDAYEMPFSDGSVSHLILVDVFHHLRRPRAFLKEARRVLCQGGRILMLEPYISPASLLAYKLHHEGVNWHEPISMIEDKPAQDYYTGQGNATRLFFSDEYEGWLRGWRVLRAERIVAFRYLLSGGYSKPAIYPQSCLGILRKLDEILSRWPKLFGVRCLIVLTPV